MSPTDTVYVSFTAEINPTTTEVLLAQCADLTAKGVKTVYLMLSTPGGGTTNGITAYNTLRAMPLKLITHNTGAVDSIGNVVFLAGDERYSSPNASFMFHGVGFDVTSPTRFEEKNLREKMGLIEADQKKIGAIIADRTKLTPSEINKLFLEAQTRDPNYALEKGIIHDIREVQIPVGAAIRQFVFKR